MVLTIYTDGASRGNPGKASYGFVVFNEEGQQIYEEGEFLGVNTNNFAEYSAVVKAFEYLKKYNNEKLSVNFFMDSKLVAEQLSGRYKIKSLNLIPLANKIRKLEIGIKAVSYRHIPREMNTLADAMANKALDALL